MFRISTPPPPSSLLLHVRREELAAARERLSDSERVCYDMNGWPNLLLCSLPSGPVVLVEED